MGKTYDICAFVVTLAVLCFCCCISSEHLNEFSDQFALLSLKESITEDPYGILTHNWTANTSVCNWFGVYCGVRHRRVTALDLGGMGLVGMIPPEMGNMSFLSFLNISRNKFHGSLPFELGHLRHLKVMSMRVNDISGEIPSSLGMLQELQHLDIAHNSLTGSAPLAIFNMSSLQIMRLRDNDLTGNLPDNLCNGIKSITEIILPNNYLTGDIPVNLASCRNLQILGLGYNNLMGKIPESIGELHMLEELYLYGNQLTGNIPSNLSNCRRLQILALSSNAFSGQIPEGIGMLPIIRQLHLGGNHLTGSIPLAIFNISSLQIMRLGNNRLTGSLPDNFCNGMKSIATISLRNNYLTGDVPVNLGSCRNLRILSLGYNNLTGKIPESIGDLPMLEELYLYGNQLTGNIPSNLSSCRRLQILSLRSNAFIGQIPEEIGMLPIIQELDLSKNHLSGIILPSMLNLSMLEVLYLQLNNLSGQLPDNFGDLLPNIQILLLNNNKLSGSIPSSIANATKLYDLSLAYNQFTGSIPATFGKLHELEILHLQVNYLTAESTPAGVNFLRSLANCRRLRKLWLSVNPLNIEDPCLVGNLSRSLEELYMDSCEIHGGIPSEIGNLTSLRLLDVFENYLVGPVPGTLGRLPKIQELYLHNNRLQGSIPIDLCQARNLGNLYLSANRLSGPIPNCFGNMTSLRDASLGNNQLSSRIPIELCDLRDLVYLDISSNKLHGSLPVGIGNFKIAVFINLSNNKLSGSIPSTISGLQEVSNFSLAGNMLQGSIPDTFSQLRSLQSLDLSRNELSGSIPNDLEGLSYLEYFNVSFNKLEGEIPTGGPFVNFSAASFMWNPGLCGMPRLQVPPCPKFSERKQKLSFILKIVLPVLGSGLLLLILTFVMKRRNKKKSDIPVQDGPHMMKHMQRISYFELLAATNQFGESNFIGAGACGSVYRAVLSDGNEVAVKVFNMQMGEAFQSFDAECEILKNIRHRNLVQVISSCSNLDFKALVFKYMKNGSLDKWLHASDHHLSFSQRLSIMIDVASAIEYLHHGYSTPVVHRDLKPSNVLLDEDMVAHVSDFGMARLLDEGQSTILSNNLATIGYMAAEYGLGGLVSTKVDVYSYGILLIETFSGKKPTDPMFETDVSLKQWMCHECSNGGSLINVIDPNLVNEDGGSFSPSMEQCFRSVVELASSCTAEMPHERSSMIEVAATLKKINRQFLASVQRGRSWRR